MRQRILTVLMAATASLASGQSAAPPETMSAANAEADVRYLDELLQRAHPDPYTAFGGRVNYAARVEELLAYARSSARVPADLRSACARFLADLGDGHTYMERFGNRGAAAVFKLPVRFGAATDALFISDARLDYGQLVGARVERVQGRAVTELERRVNFVFPRENLSGARSMLARMVAVQNGVEDLLSESPDRLNLELLLPSGKKQSVSLPFAPASVVDSATDWRQAPLLANLPRGPVAGEVLADRRVGYLRLRAMMTREAFENMNASHRTDIEQQLDGVYRTLGTPRPASLQTAIAGVPSLVEEAHRVLLEMRRLDIDRLIVDLRGNDGGWSSIMRPLLFQLFGDEYLSAPPATRYAMRVSPEGLALNNGTLEALSAAVGRPLRFGDYMFTGYDQRAGRVTREEFLALLKEQGFSRLDLLREARPRRLAITVITDGGTFSAGFDLACELARFGGRLVGTAPAQAPSGFVDGTPFVLPHSRLRGSVARTAVTHLYIRSDNRSLAIDMPMTWGRYREYGFRPDAPLECAIRTGNRPRVLTGGRPAHRR